MSIIRNYKMKSKHDNLELGVTVVVPETKLKGIVQLTHGMSEHRQRYLDFMNFLADSGYLAIIHDHRGHGESIKSKEDYGYLYEDGVTGLVSDLHQIVDEVKMKYNEVPYYIFSHSMGTLVTREWLKNNDNKIDGVILCGPPTKNNMVGLGKILVKSMMLIFEDHHRSSLIQKLTFNSYSKRFKNDPNPVWLCSSIETIKKYAHSEACGFIFTLNGFYNLFKMMKDVYKKDYQCKNSNLKIFMIAGSDDPVIKDEKEFNKTKLFLQERGYKNIETKLYPNKRHELLNEINKKEIYQDILSFIDKK